MKRMGLLVALLLFVSTAAFATDCDQECCRAKNKWPEVFYLNRLNISGNLLNNYQAVTADIVGVLGQNGWNVITDRRMLDQQKISYGNIEMMVQAYSTLNRQRRTTGTSQISLSTTYGEATVNLTLVATVALPGGEMRVLSTRERRSKTFVINSDFATNYNISIFGRRPQNYQQRSSQDYNYQDQINDLYDLAFQNGIANLIAKMNGFRSEKSN